MYCLALNLTTTGVTYDNMIIYPQVEVGGTATDWERYVGGVPAPNPDYPQAVNTVTGRQMVKVEGKNLFEVTASSPSVSGGVTYTKISDSSFSIASDGTSSWARADVTLPQLELNTTYTFKVNFGSTNPSITRVRASFRTASAEAYAFDIADGQTVTLSTGNNVITLLRIYISTYTAYNATVTFSNAQLEKGSTATDFTPYQSGEYEINLGKNLLDLNGFVKGRLDNGVLGYASNTTALSVDGDSISFTTNTNYRGVTTEYIQVVPNGTYSTNIPTTGIYGAEVAQYDSAKNFISQGPVYATQTYSGTTHYIRIYLFLRNSGSATLDDLQFERGSQATSYAPYFTPIELCKIGDYQDYIYENGGKWYVHKAVGKVILNGSESYGTRSNTSTTHSKFRITNDVLSGNIAGISTLSCDHFVANNGANTQAYSEDAICGSTASGYQQKLWFSVSNSIATTADAFKEWVANNNLTVYYALATPTDTEITNTALIDQLNALKNGGSYTGTTYIKVSATDPNLPGLLKVEAYKYD
jgi:hypothetical protein